MIPCEHPNRIQNFSCD